MFLRKLFSSDNKIAWAFVDLLIVIIGVYCAFVIQSASERDRTNTEKDRILTALKVEMEQFRFSMPQIALGMAAKEAELRATLEKEEYAYFGHFRFIEPQYGYQIIDYSMNIQNSDIVDFTLYSVLQALFVEIKKMEHTESLLTDTSRRYKTIASNLDRESSDYKIIWTENYDNFNRFLVLIGDRAEIATRVANASTMGLTLINERLGEAVTRKIEEEILLDNIGLVSTADEAVAMAGRFFPNFTESEIRDLFNGTALTE